MPIDAPFRRLVAEVADLSHHPFRRVEGVHELHAFIRHDVALVEVHLAQLLELIVAVGKVQDVERPAARVLPTIAVDGSAQVESFPCEERVGERLPATVVAEMLVDHLSPFLFRHSFCRFVFHRTTALPEIRRILTSPFMESIIIRKTSWWKSFTFIDPCPP